MTDRRGPQRSEDRSDLTPDEARAEVEAFLGEGWTVGALSKGPKILGSTPEVCAQRTGVSLYGAGPTLRAAVDALKSAWRDAVRPWVRGAWGAGYSAGCAGCSHEQIERDTRTVLGEDSNG